MLKVVYGEEVMSRARVFDWHKRSKEGRDDIHGDVKSGCPVMHITHENMKRVRNWLGSNSRKVKFRPRNRLMLTENLHVSKASRRIISHSVVV